MKKIIITAAAVVAVAAVARRFAPKMGSINWEQRFNAMPDDAPPKWMFRNIAEIHRNTDRILELLEASAPNALLAEKV